MFARRSVCVPCIRLPAHACRHTGTRSAPSQPGRLHLPPGRMHKALVTLGHVTRDPVTGPRAPAAAPAAPAVTVALHAHCSMHAAWYSRDSVLVPRPRGSSPGCVSVCTPARHWRQLGKPPEPGAYTPPPGRGTGLCRNSLLACGCSAAVRDHRPQEPGMPPSDHWQSESGPPGRPVGGVPWYS